MRLTTVALLACSLAPVMAGAQGRGAPQGERDQVATTDSTVTIPRSMVPPAGKCRIWMKGVPAAQQPAPTDCATALRQSPSNGVLVFGPAVRDLSPFERRRAAAALGGDRDRQVRADSGGAAKKAPPTRDPAAQRPPARREAATREGTARKPPPETRPPSSGTRTPAPEVRTPPPARTPPATKKPE